MPDDQFFTGENINICYKNIRIISIHLRLSCYDFEGEWFSPRTVLALCEEKINIS